LVVTKSARIVLGAAPRLEAHGRSKLLNRTSISIGRGRQNGVIIADPKVSKFHATITLANKRAYLKDIGSTNGTYLNGKPLEYDKPRELRDGDVIVVGNVELTVSH
jgi:pSer/pThr/pTyr-binding forkhead associated (FHA) protein